MRSFLNQHIGIPLVGLLRSWFLNTIIANTPFWHVRKAFYRHFCKIQLGKESSIGRGAKFTGDKFHEIHIGEHCSIPYDSFWVVGASITIGNHVVFGHRVSLYTSDHDPDDADSARRNAPIVIEERAWIGSEVTLLPGVTIGKGAVVAAGSLVTKDVAPFSIVAGRPAKFMRARAVQEFTYLITEIPWYE